VDNVSWKDKRRLETSRRGVCVRREKQAMDVLLVNILFKSNQKSISSTFYVQLLPSQIPKAQKD